MRSSGRPIASTQSSNGCSCERRSSGIGVRCALYCSNRSSRKVRPGASNTTAISSGDSSLQQLLQHVEHAEHRAGRLAAASSSAAAAREMRDTDSRSRRRGRACVARSSIDPAAGGGRRGRSGSARRRRRRCRWRSSSSRDPSSATAALAPAVGVACFDAVAAGAVGAACVARPVRYSGPFRPQAAPAAQPARRQPVSCDATRSHAAQYRRSMARSLAHAAVSFVARDPESNMVMREMHTSRSCSSVMRISHTWLRRPRCSGPRGADHEAVGDGAHVIRVDLLADAAILVRIDRRVRRRCCPAFRRARPRRRRAGCRKAGACDRRPACAPRRKSSPSSVNSMPMVLRHAARRRCSSLERVGSEPDGHDRLRLHFLQLRADPSIRLAEGNAFLHDQLVGLRRLRESTDRAGCGPGGISRRRSAAGRIASVSRHRSMPRNSGTLMSCRSR